MKKLTARLTLTTILLALLVAVSTVTGAAQVANIDEIQRAAVGLTAMPPRLGEDGSLTGEPGSTIQTEVRVRNTTNQSVLITTGVEDFIIGEDGRTPIPVDVQVDSRFSLASWIELPLTQISVPAGAIESLPVVIRVPEDARPGGRYAMVMHQPHVDLPSDDQAEDMSGRAAINQRVGTLVYFRVPGPVAEDAVIRNIDIPRFSEFGPVPINFDIENLSDIHIQPLIEIEIRNIFGRKVDTVLVETQNVFPYTMRDFSTEWDRVWGAGPYRAYFSAAYGDSGKVAMASASFWLLPYRLLMAIAILIITLIALAVLVRRYLKKYEETEHEHVELLEDRIKQLENELHQKDNN